MTELNRHIDCIKEYKNHNETHACINQGVHDCEEVGLCHFGGLKWELAAHPRQNLVQVLLP